MRRLTPDFWGITYERLEREGGVHWPCPDLDHPGTPYLFSDDFPRGAGKFWEIDYGTDSEQPDEEYPYNLSTGRVLYHWHGSTMTGRSQLEEVFPEAICEIHPDDVFRWFMTMFIDAYDWSMVPNVYGMSQFADGGLIMKTPQFFPASEVIKISNYDCADWCDTWDGLFWRFIDRHRVLFSRNEVLSKYTTKLAQMTQDDRKDFFAAA